MMFARRLVTVEDVASWRLCTGCGACKYGCENGAIDLIDIPNQGIRPVVDADKCKQCGQCLKICPGIGLTHTTYNGELIEQLRKSWGPVLELWEGYAADHVLRYNGSSGGLVTALALFCLETKIAGQVLHIGAKKNAPLENEPVLSTTREELLQRTGSRYSPASPCQNFNWIEKTDSPSIFIGKPCDIAALRKAQVRNPALYEKVVLAISIFCAGTPTTRGTMKLLETLNIGPDEVQGIRYRGCGWPGMTTVKIKGSNVQVRQMTYEQSWGDILSKYRQFRCRICPDSTGEFADISCGDPWYREAKQCDPGCSLVLVRNERGKAVLQSAMESGYVRLTKAKPEILPQSQESLLSRRRRLWGRLLIMRAMLIPTPHFNGFSLFANWRDLSVANKVRSMAGALSMVSARGD